jgi:prevent-host-death family protein
MYILSMKTINFTEFRQNASAVLDLVERGERVRVLRRGKAVAVLVPVSAEDTPSWRRPGLRLPIASGASLARAVLEERGEGA